MRVSDLAFLALHNSHRRAVYFASLSCFAVSFVLFSGLAQAAITTTTTTSLVGQPCSNGAGGTSSEIGVTKMDPTKSTVVGCFLKEEGSTEAVWKAAYQIIPSNKQLRYIFTSDQTWTVPDGVTSISISMAGGGGSGNGWRVSNSYRTGHSGGYVFSHPVSVTPGEKLSITVGKGGEASVTQRTAALAKPGAPYYIYTLPSFGDGLAGYPGTSSKVTSAVSGVLLECSGGSGTVMGGVDTWNGGGLIVGPQNGATTGSGNPPFSAPSRPATGSYVTVNGPGACGPNNYGIGNYGDTSWDPASGTYAGGATPFGYGSGGKVMIQGCYVDFDNIGKCINAFAGRSGVVFIDVIY